MWFICVSMCAHMHAYICTGFMPDYYSSYFPVVSNTMASHEGKILVSRSLTVVGTYNVSFVPEILHCTWLHWTPNRHSHAHVHTHVHTHRLSLTCTHTHTHTDSYSHTHTHILCRHINTLLQILAHKHQLYVWTEIFFICCEELWL